MSSTEKNSTVYPPGSSLLFFSDAHLGAFSDDRNRQLERELVELMEYCEEQEIRPVILGDLFDYWMEFDSRPPPLAENLLTWFRNYHRRSGNQTLFVTGNHDNWSFGYLDSLGFDVEHEYRILRAGNKRILVLHGDGLADPAMNLPRPALHRLLRNSYFIWMYQRVFPPPLGWHLMKKFSKTSKQRNRTHFNSATVSNLDTWAHSRITEDPELDAVVYGHHHKPVHAALSGKNALNCGSFARFKTAALYTNGKFELVTWMRKRRKLQTFTQKLPERNGETI
ncbi:UDP-2,3-diacylglucosamine diphosphatase [Balneolales bacterium ANBcel1]|nr:UDP-2,3-diacylglucosamine diphosphatase [Balneolales bacterium ANBcel1]